MSTDVTMHPAGFWTREAMIPGPIVPLWASVWCEPYTRGFADAFARWGYLGDGVAAAVIDGWMYGSFRPLSDPGLVPVRIARAQEAAEADEHMAAARDWLQVAGPGFERRRRRLDGDPAGSADCADRVDDAARLVRDLVRARFATIAGVQEPVTEWVLHAGERLGWPPERALALVTDAGGRAPRLDPVVAALSAAPALRARIAAGEVPLFDELAADPAVGAALADVLAADGDLLLLSDMSAPTLAEQPEHLAAAVAAAALSGTAPSGTALSGTAPSGTAPPDAAAASTAPPVAADDERALDAAARTTLERARAAHPVRDASGDALLRCCGTLRRIALAGGRALRLPDPADALLLTADELAALLRRGALADADAALLDERREAQRTALEDPPPAVLGTPPGPPPDPSGLPPAAARAMQRVGTLVALRSPDAVAGPLTGTPASAGRYAGVARVVLRVEDAPALRPFEVLVCPVTGPAWNMAMARSGAVVCDSGGQLSHAAITARELGVPAVVGCRDATATLRTGEHVLVDGAAGTVRRL